MVRPVKKRFDALEIDFSFEVLPEDEFGNPRVDIEGNFENDTAIFPDAVEDFEGLIIDGDGVPSEDGLPFQFDEIVIGEVLFPAEGDDVVLPGPLTLDLATRARGTANNNGSTTDVSLEYIILGDELREVGLDELALIIDDADSDFSNGFQFVVDGEERTVNLDTAIHDIGFITGENSPLSISPLVLADRISFRGPSATNPPITTNLTTFTNSGENLLIEAEDLELDGLYQPETFGSGENSLELIGLRDSTIDLRDISGDDTRVVTGEASLRIGSPQADISGDYNLVVSTFDEVDGDGTIRVLVNGVPQTTNVDGIGVDEIVLSENPDGEMNDVPNEDIRREFTFNLGSIDNGDEIIIEGTSNNMEFVRLDWIRLEEQLF